jgi:hypothetical protein
MATLYENVQRWFDVQLIGSKNKYFRPSNSNIWGNQYALYSFGTHFRLVEIIRDSKDKPVLILMNGNNYSPTTSSHQRVVRGYIEMQTSMGRFKIPHVIIPFDALDAAGVVRSSIRLIDRTDDTWEEKTYRQHSRPERLKTENFIHAGQWNFDPRERKHVYEKFEVPLTKTYYTVDRWPVTRIEDPNSPTGVTWEWTTRRHWLGESLIKCSYQYRSVKTGWTKKNGVYFISGFDRNERRPSYFFAQLPSKVRPTTLAEAYECLKPESVKAAEMLGVNVKRQGDIFAIELSSVTKRELTKQGATYERMGSLLDTNHVATDVARLPDGTLLARGVLYHQPRWRRPDHRRVPLGKQWHVIVKNTVPIVGGR